MLKSVFSWDITQVKPYTQYPRKLQSTWLKQDNQKIQKTPNPWLLQRRQGHSRKGIRGTIWRWWKTGGLKNQCLVILNHLGKEYIHIQQSFQLMKHSGLKGETEGLTTPAWDQALDTRYYNKHIMKEGHTDRCRMCHSQAETIEHISGCQTLACWSIPYWHNQVAAQICAW